MKALMKRFRLWFQYGWRRSAVERLAEQCALLSLGVTRRSSRRRVLEVGVRRSLGKTSLSENFGTDFKRSLKARPRFVVVLLQYGSLKHTEACLNSLEPFFLSEDLQVVLVDNYSSQQLVDDTRRLFGDRTGVHLLLRAQNDGFARGNNAGYRFAKDTLGADFILVFNNDILFDDLAFFKILRRSYARTHFSILGPDIQVRAAGGVIHQNPSFFRIRSKNELALRVAREESRPPELDVPKGGGTHVVRGRKSKVGHRTDSRVLHGSALVFSPIFVSDFDEPFDPRTFLYGEEPILYLRAISRGHKPLYEPAVWVTHNTDASEYKDTQQHIVARKRWAAESRRVLLRVIEELEATTRNTL